MQEPRTSAERLLYAFKNKTHLWTKDGNFVATFATPWFQAPEIVTWGSRTFRLTLSDTEPGLPGQDGTMVHHYNEGANFVLLDECKLSKEHHPANT